MTKPLESIQTEILEFIDESNKKITPLEIEKILSQQHPYSRRNIRYALRDLVTQGLISYTNCFGQTYIERSFQSANRLTESVIVKSPEISWSENPSDVVVTMRSGAAFGNGSHPSTRLAVKGLEHTLQMTPFLESHGKTKMLDIGTGSGILSLVALKMGVQSAVGVDTDPCSRHESMENARLNGLTGRFTIQNRSLNDIKDTYHIITANLRFPTLMRFCSKISSIIVSTGIVVLSGIKTEESCQVAEAYQKYGFNRIWGSEEKGWESMVFIKNIQEVT